MTGTPHSSLSHLECSRTATTYDADEVHGLSEVGAPLLARYDLERVRTTVTREEIAGRPPSLWRYHEVLPVRDPAFVTTLGEGMTPLLAPSSAKIHSGRFDRRNQPIRFRKASGALHPMVERLSFRLIDSRFLNSPEQRWHRSRCSSQARESAASNSPSKNACRTSLQSEQAPAVLILVSGAGEKIMTMRTMSLSENISSLA